MTKHVPEERNEDAEVRELMNLLTGHEIFRRNRNTFPLAWPLEDLVSKCDSPSSFLREWDRLVADGRVLGTMLAQLKRDGKTTAFHHFTRALRKGNHVLPGEAIPIEQTTPATIVILDPDRMLPVIYWQHEGDGFALWHYLRRKSAGMPPSFENPLIQQRIEALLEAFPEIESQSLKLFRESPRFDTYDLGDKIVEICTRHLWPSAVSSLSNCGSVPLRVPYEGQEHQMTFSVEHLDLAYVVFEEQGALLARFPRAEQGRIATWQINIPTAILDVSGESRRFDEYLGFHPESEHAAWQQRFPTLSSRGVSHGWGLTLLQDHLEREAHEVCHDGRRIRGKEQEPLRFSLLCNYE